MKGNICKLNSSSGINEEANGKPVTQADTIGITMDVMHFYFYNDYECIVIPPGNDATGRNSMTNQFHLSPFGHGLLWRHSDLTSIQYWARFMDYTRLTPVM
jgi:hypothetical protein